MRTKTVPGRFDHRATSAKTSVAPTPKNTDQKMTGPKLSGANVDGAASHVLAITLIARLIPMDATTASKPNNQMWRIRRDEVSICFFFSLNRDDSQVNNLTCDV